MDAGQIAIQVTLIVIITLIVGVIGIFIFMKIKNSRRYDTLCIIMEKVSGIMMITRDVAGIFVDSRTNNKRFFLKKNNVGLNPDNIPYILNEKAQRVVFLHKFGLKNFEYIKLQITDEKKVNIEVGEEDVNWGINAYERQKKIFGTALLEKLLPYIGIALMGLFILAMVIFVMKDMKEMMPMLQSAAASLNSAAQALAQAQTGTAVIPS